MGTEIIDRSRVRNYFKGSKGPIILMIIGIATIAIIIGIFLLIAGIIWYCIDRFAGKSEVESEIDRLIVVETERLKERGMDKLNIIGEQVNIIEPICLNGPSYDPNPEASAAAKFNLGSIFAFVNPIMWVTSIIKLFKKDPDADPVFMSKVGADGKWRYSLVEINIFMFDEKQVYLYYAYMDITTGLIFHEGTHEYFYSDICAINTNQISVKIFNAKKKKFERKLFEYITVYTSGCHHKASMSTEISASILDRQFTAMRNLVRDKKTEKSYV